MISEREPIELNSLYVGLTRPPMYLGVTVTFLGINTGITLIAYILTHSFIKVPIFWVLMQALGWMGCHYDPRIFDLLLGWFESKSSSFNSSYWGCNSYEPF
jgi:type IV secretion system protein VirB3